MNWRFRPQLSSSIFFLVGLIFVNFFVIQNFLRLKIFVAMCRVSFVLKQILQDQNNHHLNIFSVHLFHSHSQIKDPKSLYKNTLSHIRFRKHEKRFIRHTDDFIYAWGISIINCMIRNPHSALLLLYFSFSIL